MKLEQQEFTSAEVTHDLTKFDALPKSIDFKRWSNYANTVDIH